MDSVKIGFANGCFDLFHDGHQYFLTECRRQCGYLIVAVNSDEYCKRVKGIDRPFEPLMKRMWHVRAIADSVLPFGGREERLIMEIRPDIVFKGQDHSPDQTFYAARRPRWKDGHAETPIMWVCPVVHIGLIEGVSTTLVAQSRVSHEQKSDAAPERAE